MHTSIDVAMQSCEVGRGLALTIMPILGFHSTPHDFSTDFALNSVFGSTGPRSQMFVFGWSGHIGFWR